jgi:hypothetical protein
MSELKPVNCNIRLVFALIAIGMVALFSAGCYETATQEQSKKPLPQKEQQQLKAMVEQGDEIKAKEYYAETFKVLGLKSDIDHDEPGLEVMLAFLGYKDLTPKSLENDSSAQLMERYGDDLLASAFFAPKITDVSQKPDDINVGWRKVIRLRARAGSDAVKKGIAAGYVLFNKFQGTNRDANPFDEKSEHESQTTQLILVRSGKSSDSKPQNRPLHFFVYGPASAGAKLKLALAASFDAAAPQIENEIAKTVKPYYVPLACGQCHGGIKFNDDDGKKVVDHARQKLNMLDTDHWFDRIQSGEDFAFLQDSKHPVLFDGDKDPSSPKFKAAFDVLRRLNTEIKAQNDLVEDPAKPSFQYRAINLWLNLHKDDTSHKDVFTRALDPLPGAGPKWSRDCEPDRQLLPAMNRYCYRCHSSIAYNVFDRPAVASKNTKIISYLKLSPEDIKHMPQDRVLNKPILDTLLALFAKLPACSN